MKIIKLNEAKVELVNGILSKGGLIIFPCETVYGIAVDSQSLEGVTKLNEYKQRPFGKPYAIMVNDQNTAEKYVELNEIAKNLYKSFLPGPMTIVSKGKHRVVLGVESETGSLGVRIPDYQFMLDLLKDFGKPIVATSANASYKRRPYKVSDILDNISDKQKSLVDLIIDAGELPHNEPSTVIDTTLDEPVILRQGEVKINDQVGVTSFSEEQTRNVGKELWQKYEKYFGQRAIVFALDGPMGAGKTHLTKGIAKAMGINEEVVSPTFNLELDYGNRLCHFDAWRLQNGDELESLGFKAKINDKLVLVIEWADRVADLIKKYNEEAVVIWVKINYGKMENERLIKWGVA